MIRLRVDMPQRFQAFVDERRSTAERAVQVAVTAAIDGAKFEMRQKLPGRLGMAIGDLVFPDRGASLGARGVIYARDKRGHDKWDRVLDLMARGGTVRREDGQGWLAIPTENVPNLGRGVEVKPRAVEFYFGRPLRYVPPKVTGGDHGLLVLDQVVAAKGRRGGFKNATRRRLADGREVRSVVMFVLVPQVTVRARFDPAAIMQTWADRMPELIDRALPDGGA